MGIQCSSVARMPDEEEHLPLASMIAAMSQARSPSASLARSGTLALCAMLAACQSSVGPTTGSTASPARLEYVNEFRKIDTRGRGRIGIDEATAYYTARFAELDVNRDG